MCSATIYLDTRSNKEGKPAPVKAVIRCRRETALISLGIKVEPQNWDKKKCAVVNHPNAQRMNLIINRKKIQIDAAIMRLMDEGECLPSMSAQELKERIILIIDPDAKERHNEQSRFVFRFERFISLKEKPGTRKLYEGTLKKLEMFDPNICTKKFEQITRDYLKEFEAFCAKTQKRNGRNIHLRNIRAVFNDAIDADVTSFYPFRRMKITYEPTRKKALTVEQMRLLCTCECEPYQEQYRDMFLLMFMLRGINIGDLCLAQKDCIRGGRFEYRRNKVGTLFSVRVEPEAEELIRKYAGKNYLLNPLDNYKDYHDYMHHLNAALKAIGRGIGKQGRVISEGYFPGLSSNWARHTWATVASYLDISKDIISRGLGHSMGLAVTDIYIDFDFRKVDDANRKVLDYVLYGKDYRQP